MILAQGPFLMPALVPLLAAVRGNRFADSREQMRLEANKQVSC